MKVHEYQGKEILREYGVNTPRGYHAYTVNGALAAAKDLGGPIWVVKAQIHAGGRGLGGGVKIAKSMADVEKYANEILGMQLVTHQTGPEGQEVRRLFIEEGVDIKKEYYVASPKRRLRKSTRSPSTLSKVSLMTKRRVLPPRSAFRPQRVTKRPLSSSLSTPRSGIRTRHSPRSIR